MRCYEASFADNGVGHGQQFSLRVQENDTEHELPFQRGIYDQAPGGAGGFDGRAGTGAHGAGGVFPKIWH